MTKQRRLPSKSGGLEQSDLQRLIAATKAHHSNFQNLPEESIACIMSTQETSRCFNVGAGGFGPRKMMLFQTADNNDKTTRLWSYQAKAPSTKEDVQAAKDDGCVIETAQGKFKGRLLVKK